MAFLNQGAARRPDEPVGRLFDYVDNFVEQATSADMPACLIGVLTLELAAVNEEFRSLCQTSLDAWSGTLEQLIGDALSETGRDADVPALSKHFLSTIQGSMLLAKANGNPAVIAESVSQLRNHIEHVVGATA